MTGLSNCKNSSMRPSWLFLPPAIFEALKLLDSDGMRTAILDQLEASKKDTIFLLVQDKKDQNSRGNHFTLLIWSRPHGKYFLYDSNKNQNSKKTDASVDQGNYLDLKLNDFAKAVGYTQNHSGVSYVDCPQQNKAEDCGVYMNINLRYAIVQVIENKLGEPIQYPDHTAEVIRQRLIKHIESKR